MSEDRGGFGLRFLGYRFVKFWQNLVIFGIKCGVIHLREKEMWMFWNIKP